MRHKKIILIIAILTLMVFSSLSLTKNTYAYWIGAVNGASDIATGTVILGEWNQIFQWDPDATYEAGDIVTNNGITYEAKRNNPTREPGVDNGWNRDWDELG